jgi:hypothetical protein
MTYTESEIGTQTPGQWQAIHIFYAANRRAMLTDSLKPMIDSLRAEGLLERYFFITYWLEGPHLRLRLLPTSAAATSEVVARAHETIAAFLKVRPALYEVRSEFMVGMYNTMFDLEFSAEQRARYVGDDNRMRLRKNNTFSDEPYEPEYGKYGGPAGVALAEWHFEHSSNLVIDALRTMNVHLRRVLLGISAQLMMVMTTAFLDDVELTLDYLQRYHDFWRRAFNGTSFVADDEYDEAYQAMGSAPVERYSVIRQAFAENRVADLPEFFGGWAAHCLELRQRVEALAVRGELVFRSWDGTRDEQVTDPQAALLHLLSPYLHMTNNRLQVTLTDEAYLAHVLAQSLRADLARQQLEEAA